jgi:hypothetical protein
LSRHEGVQKEATSELFNLLFKLPEEKRSKGQCTIRKGNRATPNKLIILFSVGLNRQTWDFIDTAGDRHHSRHSSSHTALETFEAYQT